MAFNFELSEYDYEVRLEQELEMGLELESEYDQDDADQRYRDERDRFSRLVGEGEIVGFTIEKVRFRDLTDAENENLNNLIEYENSSGITWTHSDTKDGYEPQDGDKVRFHIGAVMLSTIRDRSLEPIPILLPN